METREIFENLIKIEPKVMAIESLFNNPERLKQTNYQPSYQRNYVWDDEKATYFIESILLGTEIPPLIYFRDGTKVEVIDGRQRYQTILRFIKNEFKLKKNGLQALDSIGIANKNFDKLGDLKDVFWDTKLRIIEFSFHSKNSVTDEIEDIVKKEIFKRYNSGITPLKPTDIDKAAYVEDDLNSYIKTKLKADRIIYDNISSLFYFEKSNLEVILKKIRQLLVQHKIPIKYYSNQKDKIVTKYYDFLFAELEQENIEGLYTDFIEKINWLIKIKKIFEQQNLQYNRLIFECLFWAFSILDQENIALNTLNDILLNQIVGYISSNIKAFEMDRSSFSKELYTRYQITSNFFEEKYSLDFSLYLNTSNEFKKENKEIATTDEGRTSFDELRINKPEPSSIAIEDICRQMERQRFLIRPPYQRNEVINKKKSSSIIESILMGIKLPPIFIFKRTDGISEVLDGQQRLLSILGFIQRPYLDENNDMTFSKKNGYTLNLKDGILKNLNTKKFGQLPKEAQDQILNFDLWTIEINQRNNLNFDQIDLFIRLNSKPYPIKENTFEMWNSYISSEIIETIKKMHRRNENWFYFRKNNSRMEDETVYTSLVYLQYLLNNNKNFFKNSQHLNIYKVGDKVNFRIKSKNEISKVLENPNDHTSFLDACHQLENNFILILKNLLQDDSDENSETLNKNLDYIFDVENSRRTQQSFYALWYFLTPINSSKLLHKKHEARNLLKELFISMGNIESRKHFDSAIQDFWKEFA